MAKQDKKDAISYSRKQKQRKRARRREESKEGRGLGRGRGQARRFFSSRVVAQCTTSLQHSRSPFTLSTLPTASDPLPNPLKRAKNHASLGRLRHRYGRREFIMEESARESGRARWRRRSEIADSEAKYPPPHSLLSYLSLKKKTKQTSPTRPRASYTATRPPPPQPPPRSASAAPPRSSLACSP